MKGNNVAIKLKETQRNYINKQHKLSKLPKNNYERLDRIFHIVFFLAAFIAVLAVSSITVFIFVRGLPAIKEIGLLEFVFGQKWKPSDHSQTG